MTDRTITALRRRLEKWELEHLRKLATDQAERIERLQSEVDHAYQIADGWQNDAMRLAESLLDDGQEIGITQSGELVVVEAEEEQPILIADHFVTVPETTLPGGLVVPAFQIGVYAATRGEDGKATVRPDAAPWVDINYRAAKHACEAAGYAAITETQWLAAAYNASQVDANWTGGKVGEGELFQGIRNGNVSSAQPGSYEPTDSTERRWLTLSNGERICDLNGNVYQWVVDDVQGDAEGIIARPFASDSPTRTAPPYPSRTHGMGDTETGDWSGRALVRGGCWYSESNAGAFSLNFDWPDYAYAYVGFRCTKPIGL